MGDLPATAPAISIQNLNYHFPDGTPALTNINLTLPSSSRTLLIGANGAGKTTLLRLLSGKKLAPNGQIFVGGVDPFKFGLEGVTYLGLEWVLNPIVRNDIEVWRLLESVGGDVYRERRDELVGILDVDTEWRMHAVSDGERRRVQLCMGLLRPWSILLLDEVTVDLDVLARSRFLSFLKRETETRPCTIVYATHIMDGLSTWPTHLIRMTLGTVRQFGPIEILAKELLMRRQKQAQEEREVQERVGRNGNETPEQLREMMPIMFRNSALLELALEWLEEDLAERGPRKPRQVGEGKLQFN